MALQNCHQFKGRLISKSVLSWSFPQRNEPNHYPITFQPSEKVEDSDLAHFFEETAYVKNFLRFSQLWEMIVKSSYLSFWHVK